MITDNFRQVIEYYHSLIEKGLHAEGYSDP